MQRTLEVKFGKHLLLSIGFSFVFGNAAVSSGQVERSLSASRQFVLYGTTAPLRGAVADVAERTKATALGVLQQRDEWKIPIILNLQFPQANVPEIPTGALRFSQTGAGLKIQLDLTIAADFDVLTVRRQLLRGVLLEMIYRHVPDLPAGSFYVEPPDWLIQGMLAADRLQDGNAMVEAMSSLAASNKLMTLDDFLQRRFDLLDSPGQLLYRAYALAFLQLLINQPAGPARLSAYVNTLARDSSDPMADLKTHFPEIARGPATDALWRMSIASLTRRPYELLTAAESERQLDELLGADQSPDAATPRGLSSLVKKKLSASETAELRQLKQKLMLLGTQANPALRPLVLEYQAIAGRILAHKVKGMTARLATVSQHQKKVRIRTGEIDDYMNWFEATKSGSTSGVFSGYLRAAARSTDEPLRRRDPISVYLDSLEEQF